VFWLTRYIVFTDIYSESVVWAESEGRSRGHSDPQGEGAVWTNVILHSECDFNRNLVSLKLKKILH